MYVRSLRLLYTYIPFVVPSAEPVPVSEEPSMDVDVCEKSEIGVDISVIAGFDSLHVTPGKDAIPSKPMKSLTDTDPEVVTRSPEVGLEDHVIQVCVESESGTNIAGLEGKGRDKTEHDGVKEGVIIDGAIAPCAKRQFMDESTGELPAVLTCLKSECLLPSPGPLLLIAAPD